MERTHPYDYAFASLEPQFQAIRDEAASLARDDLDRVQFAALPSVQHLLNGIEAPDKVSQHAAAGQEYRAVLFAAYRYWDAGLRTQPVSKSSFELALGWSSKPLALEEKPLALYLQLPEQWFWTQIDEAAPHEPIDGIFVATSPRREITLVAPLGVRGDRAGFSQVSIAATLEELWNARELRRVPPFAPVIEGGDRAGMRSIVTTAELLDLAAVALRAVHVAGAPETTSEG